MGRLHMTSLEGTLKKKKLPALSAKKFKRDSERQRREYVDGLSSLTESSAPSCAVLQPIRKEGENEDRRQKIHVPSSNFLVPSRVPKYHTDMRILTVSGIFLPLSRRTRM